MKKVFIKKLNDYIDFQLADENDLNTILDIWIKGQISINSQVNITKEHIKNFELNFQKRKKPYNFWVARRSEVVGWCSILPIFLHPLKQKTDAEVSTYLEPKHNGSGIGQEIMKFVFAEIENSFIENVWGFSSTNNQPSIKMCEKAGMRVCGETSSKVILIKEF